tara:strand:- start:2045 stop:3397 length:1353 start_codon:yes stop_codon:yes gene_type:complete
MKLSQLRSTFDTLQKANTLEDYIPIMMEVIEEHNDRKEKLSVEFGNSLFHSLSFLDEKVITYNDWVELFNIIKDLIKDPWDFTTFNNLIKIYCSEFGFRFISTKNDFEEFIINHIMKMEIYGFELKMKTFLPIFNICYIKSISSLAKNCYLTCKVRNIKIKTEQLVKMLFIKESIFRSNIIHDIVNTDEVFSQESISIMRDCFSNSKNGTIKENVIQYSKKEFSDPLEKFRINAESHNKILDTIRAHVNSITRSRKSNWEIYNNFIKFIKTINYKFVLDAANIGRFEQGKKSDKNLNFKQIRLVVEKCIDELSKSKEIIKPEKIILFLNENHLKRISAFERSDIQFLKENTIIYETPRGIDDDLFWLYAAVFNQDSLLVTSDELRNHTHTINGNFMKWKKYNRITFKVNKSKTNVTLNIPLLYEVKPFIDRRFNELSIPISECEWITFEI